eukprot:gnl/MRDRNA2_/MRDRNA2_35395_c0_seq1.p1 gnl/MRDRNA2_/MRDRNA2_35395_c0~~gnl/MRDRNA2_/MRDRNA2_35395_c0_seq1.p1  ORF type:complete len:158 (+),score=27.81 gnl/MRDRNA2_/MRDRNA2_35395_c0_seq1:389-862(+)
MISKLAMFARQHVGDFMHTDLAGTAWLLARESYLDRDLFTLMAQVAKRSITQFRKQELAKISWGYAKADHVDAELFAVIAKHVRMCINDRYEAEFTHQELSNIAWSFAKVCHSDQFSEESKATLGRFCGIDELFMDLAPGVKEHLDHFGAQELSKVA